MEKGAAYCTSLSTFGLCKCFELPCKTSEENLSQVGGKKTPNQQNNPEVECLRVSDQIKVPPSPLACFCQ